MIIDTTSKIPLYAQVKDYVLDKIRSEEWGTGFTLPTEQDLQDLLNVSRVTVRHAIEELEYEGYVKKKQGKGTYVSPPKLSYPLPKLTSFSEDMRQKGFTPSSKTLEIRIAQNPCMAQQMGLSDQSEFLYLRRQRMIDNMILGIQDSHINLALLDRKRIHAEVENGDFVEKLDQKSLSLYDLFEHEHHIHIGYADESIEAIACTRDFAALLNVKSNTPLLFLDRLTFTEEGQPLECARMYNRADIYKYSIRLTR